MGRPAKLSVVSMVANDFSIADPQDAGMLDFVGFDTSTPALLSDFARMPYECENGFTNFHVPQS